MHTNENTIDDLPDEILEFILSYLPPYKDLEECRLVNKRWYRSVHNVIRTTKNNLNRAISEFNVKWFSLRPAEMAPTIIAKRYCHSACIHGNSMYVFGGCTSSSTTFNDLWRLDLSKRQWIRPLTMGNYPSPKACATLTCHKDRLILFGGWTHPSPYPLHQAWRLFNELHIYNITSNRWTFITTTSHPPPIAGHSVSVHNDIMIMFGGLQRTVIPGQYSTSNDLWCLNLETFSWYKPYVSSLKPVPRYGHSQIVLDDNHILIIGGCGGPNNMYHDVWVLKIGGEIWSWRQLHINNKEWAPTQLWCNPACQIGNKIIVLSRNPATSGCISYSAKWNVPSQLRPNNCVPAPSPQEFPDIPVRRNELPVLDRDENVNGRRGRLNDRNIVPSSSSDEDMEPIAGPSGVNKVQIEQKTEREQMSPTQRAKIPKPYDPPLNLSAFLPVEERRNRNRERQLASLRKMEERIKNQSRKNNSDASNKSQNKPKSDKQDQGAKQPLFLSYTKKKTRKHVLSIFVLDISQALNAENPSATWLPWKNTDIDTTDCPEETILYSLVPGKGELIMFGGIQKDGDVHCLNCVSNCISHVPNQVSNSLHFITAPRVQI